MDQLDRMTGPLAAYRRSLEDGVLSPDPAQAVAIEKLESLSRALAGYSPDNGGGWLERFGLARKTARRLEWMPGDCVVCAPKQGLYLYGEVGRGKSMLMDLFFDKAPVAAKRRVHFHEFMRSVHDALFRLRAEAPNETDPIVVVAGKIAAECTLLCFDELQVTDIADAMIVGRLFESLFERGVVVVTTSNRAPGDLYKNGLKRDRFLPFIDIIEQALDVLELSSEKDYRLGRRSGMEVYFTPQGPMAEEAMKGAFEHLTSGAKPVPDYIYVNGRAWLVSRTAKGVAWFDFDDLCDRPRGPSDYLELATLFHAVMVSGVPMLSPERRDAAKRFSTLIDALYEHKALFVCSAAAMPDALYPQGDGSFEFRRTVSRLMEMQSVEYLGRAHLT